MNKTQRKRLAKLADHLDHGQLGHKRFNFSKWNTDIARLAKAQPVPHCGTVGCGIGECPVLFPKHWHFREFGGEFSASIPEYRPVLRRRRYYHDKHPCLVSAASFFGVSYEVAECLFTPEGSRLPRHARRKTVAKHLRMFLKEGEDGLMRRGLLD